MRTEAAHGLGVHGSRESVTEILAIESDPTALIDDLKVDQPRDIEISQVRYRDSNTVRRGAWRTDRFGVARPSAKEAAL
jgi:hypothetical protein